MALNNECEIKDKIDELKNRLKQHVDADMLDDDCLFYRFLKAKNFNVDDAECMLKAHSEWRQKHDLKNIMDYENLEVIQKYLPINFLGYDKEGCGVRYLPLGNIDWIGLFLSTKKEDVEKLVIQILEMDTQIMKAQSKKLGNLRNKITYIYNLENLSFAQVTDKNAILSLIANLNMYMNNYPGTLKKAYVVHGNIYFDFVLAVVKRCLPNSTLKKIKIYTDDSWKEDLLEAIDADVLPAFLGGTRTDPDGNPLCKTFINNGGPVPESYYIHKSKRSLASCPDVQMVTLSNAAFHEVKLEVKEPGSYLEWEFETKSRDIGFGLFLQEIANGEEENIELIPIQRINTDEYAETGMYLCEKEGTYIVVFDNTYSWVRSKEIFYRIKVVSPEEQEN